MNKPGPGIRQGDQKGNDSAAPFRRIRIWELCFELALEVIRLTDRFPKPEGNGLVAEIRSVAILIPSYLADIPGNSNGRKYLGDLYQSLSSIARLEIQILICAELGYLKREEFLRVEGKILEVRKLAGGILRNIRSAGRGAI